jgi:hypothetical protein
LGSVAAAFAHSGCARRRDQPQPEDAAAGEIRTLPPMTLGNAAAAHVPLVVWCKACQHQVEPDAAEHSERYGAEMPIPAWRERLICSKCGSRDIDMVATGTKRRPDS